MRYIARDDEGKVVGAFAGPQPFETEEVAADHPDYLAFIARAAAPPSRIPRLVIADRLTDAEVALVAGLQSGTAEQQRWWLRWVSATEVDAADPANVAAFEAVFGVERAAELLAPEVPDDEPPGGDAGEG